MLTKADDYPIHQLSLPISEVGSDRNFYDRYFFNGYNKEGDIFFAVALCVYPNLNIMDGSFVVVRNGIQHNCRYSRVMGLERMDTKVGALEVKVLEPLHKLQILVDDKAASISADLTFEGRFEAIQEPKMILNNGPRVVMDTTRLTQQGFWSGNLRLLDEEIKLENQVVYGTRDRSWGIRPVGKPDSQPVAPYEIPQFYWLWCPANFDNFSTHMYFVDDAKGKSINSHSVIQGKQYSETLLLENLTKEVSYVSESRRVERAEFTTHKGDGESIKVTIKPKFNIYMCGLGYMHPEWGHGQFKGENESSYDTYDLKEDPHDPPFLHIQGISDITYTDKKASFFGTGVLEQLFIGPHKPSGFEDLLDRPKKS